MLRSLQRFQKPEKIQKLEKPEKPKTPVEKFKSESVSKAAEKTDRKLVETVEKLVAKEATTIPAAKEAKIIPPEIVAAKDKTRVRSPEKAVIEKKSIIAVEPPVVVSEKITGMLLH